MVERPARKLNDFWLPWRPELPAVSSYSQKRKNLQPPANRRMKAFDESQSALTVWAGLILLLTEKLAAKGTSLCLISF